MRECRSALAVTVSCLVHGVVFLGMGRYGRASGRSAAEPVWFELQVEQPPRAPPQPEPPPAPVVDAPRAPPTRRERAAVKRVVHESAPLVSPEPGAAADTAAPGPRAPTIDLSPLAAARTLGDSTTFPVRDAGVAAHHDSPTAQADALAQQVPGLRASRGSGRNLEGAVVDAIEDTLYNVLRPWQLLRRTMRGSQYRYTGAGFDAAILPDGRVRFRDKGGPALSVTTIQPRESGPSAQVGPSVATPSLNLGDPRVLWHRLRGKDPFAAERRLFLERTRELREYLAGRAAERGTPLADESSEDVDWVEPQLEPRE